MQQAPCGLHLPRSKQEIYLSVIYKGRSLLALCGGRLVGYREPLGSLQGPHQPFLSASMASPRVGLHMEAVIGPFLPE